MLLVLLDFFNSKMNKSKGEQNQVEVDFLKERQQLRLKGEKLNLFKNLDIVGWQITDSNPYIYLKLHKQLQTFSEAEIQENKTFFFKYLFCFDLQSTQTTLYELEENTMQISQSKVEPQSKEMIGIPSLFSLKNNNQIKSLTLGLIHKFK